AFHKVPQVPSMKESTTPERIKEGPEDVHERVRLAYAFLLWQRSEKPPTIDVKGYERSFVEATGEEAFALLEALPEKEHESLRYLAEQKATEIRELKPELVQLVRVIHVDRLQRELHEATRSLKRAEEEGNEKETATLMETCGLLTGQLAKLK